MEDAAAADNGLGGFEGDNATDTDVAGFPLKFYFVCRSPVSVGGDYYI